MELRDLVNSLLSLEDTEKTRGSGRTHRMLVRMLDTILSSPDEGWVYAFLAHDRFFADECRDRFVAMLEKRVVRDPDGGNPSHVVGVSADKVLIDSRRVYFLSNPKELQGGANFKGIYEDHHNFSMRLAIFMNSNPCSNT